MDATSADQPVQYPMLYELLRAQAPPTVDDIPQVQTVSTSLNPLNRCCPLCNQTVASAANKPVVLLPCGHAYHVTCGRMYLARAEGKESTSDGCHRTEKQVEVARLRQVADAAIARGEFKMVDLRDPVLRRDIMSRLQDLYDDVQHSGDASKAVAHAAAADENLRDEEAYRVHWLATRVGREGFSFLQKARMLSPYMKNPMAVKREEVTMSRLLDLEHQLRCDARGDDDATTPHTEAAIGNSADMHERISVTALVGAGLSLSDIYFGLDLRGWQPLCDVGFKKEFITDKNGPFALTALADLYGVNYKSLVEIGWTVDDIVEKHHTPQELANVEMGFREMWADMGMTREEFMDLGFSARKWHDVLGLDKKYLEKPLGIGTAELQLMRWTVPEFVKAFDLHPMEQRQLGLNDIAPMLPAVRQKKKSRRVEIQSHDPAPRRRPKPTIRVLTLEGGRDT